MDFKRCTMNYAIKILCLEDKRLDNVKDRHDKHKTPNRPDWAAPVYYDAKGHQEIKAAIKLLTNKPTK